MCTFEKYPTCCGFGAFSSVFISSNNTIRCDNSPTSENHVREGGVLYGFSKKYFSVCKLRASCNYHPHSLSTLMSRSNSIVNNILDYHFCFKEYSALLMVVWHVQIKSRESICVGCSSRNRKSGQF